MDSEDDDARAWKLELENPGLKSIQTFQKSIFLQAVVTIVKIDLIIVFN